MTCPNCGGKIGVTTDVPAELESVAHLVSVVRAERRSCIYFLIEGGKVMYVGKSISPMVRFGGHVGIGRKFDSVACLPCDPEDLDATETEWIRRLMPPLNFAKTGRKRKGKRPVRPRLYEASIRLDEISGVAGSVNELALRRRLKAALVALGAESVAQAANLAHEDILSLTGIGGGSLYEITGAIEKWIAARSVVTAI